MLYFKDLKLECKFITLLISGMEIKKLKSCSLRMIPCILNLETSQLVGLLNICDLKCSNMEKGAVGAPEDNVHIGL